MSAAIIISTVACAPKVPAQNTALMVLDASEQRTIPGRKESAIESQYRIVALWRSTEQPDSFRLLKNGISMPCTLLQDGRKTSLSSVHRGDTLVLSASTAHPLTSDIGSAKMDNCLMYKVSGSDWYYTIIPSIRKQPDNKLP